jgi:mannose-6-phosphate isomerase-like protein (cupin superfamily)
VARYTYPHVIENGSGERLTFVRVAPGRAADRLEAVNLVRPGSGPPMHAHLLQEESLTVQRGRMGYQRPGEPAQFAAVGESVVFKRGEAHKFWNAGDGDLECLGYIEPPDNIEYFLTQLYDSTRRNGGKAPNLFEAAFLIRRYRSEFVMLEIPALVQLAVFPVLIAIGTLLGKYRKYGDAPERVRG